MEFIWLLVGFAILLYSGKFLVTASVGIAERTKVSRLVIGVTIVSFGTSAPELFVSVMSAMKGEAEFAIANVVGSNIANIALVLGVTVVIFPLAVKKFTVTSDTPFMLLISTLFYLFASQGQLKYYHGIIFLALIIGYTIYIIRHSKKHKEEIALSEVEEVKQPVYLLILMLVGSVIGLAVASKLLVDNAEIIALRMGISKRVVGIIALAFGTSLPELATSIIAAFKKEVDISVGNIVGSNIYNILTVLGISSLFTPINVDPLFLSFDIPVMLGIATLLYLFLLPANRSMLTRWKGFVFIFAYLAYVIIIFIKK